MEAGLASRHLRPWRTTNNREALGLNESVILELPVDNYVLHLARMQRSQPEPGLHGKSDIGIEFIDIRQNEFNLVMSLVFRLQLKFQRQKTVSSS